MPFGDYTSYCRCVRAVHRSNGKVKDQHKRRNGNPYLAWAFVEAVHHAIRSSEDESHAARGKAATESQTARNSTGVNSRAGESTFLLDQNPIWMPGA
jgi:transposase